MFPALSLTVMSTIPLESRAISGHMAKDLALPRYSGGTCTVTSRPLYVSPLPKGIQGPSPSGASDSYTLKLTRVWSSFRAMKDDSDLTEILPVSPKEAPL